MSVPEILNCIKNSGINDPNVDLMIGALTGNVELVQKGLKEGADVNITDREIIEKYKDIIQKNCPDLLKNL